ncbi:hypothetical protein GCM10009623_19180 [Nocardioides aestuarii]|uniref:DUF4232 domain-containing protein n=1 Tax=Nocardioides aestuarii TaxID=252231 RepID=A0ABW4TKG6_9ACTN
MSRRRAAATVVVAVLLLGGCSGAPATPEAPAPTATLGFTQLIPKEGTRHALLRVTNTGEDDLVVESVAVEWPGYAGGEPSPADPTIPAGRTLDLQLDLPDPTCEPTDEAPVGIVTTSTGTIRAELEATGATYLRRLWRTQCDTAYIESTVAITYSPQWRVVGQGVDARALGWIGLERRDGEEAVTVTDVDGSVLHGLRLPGPTTLEAGEQRVEVPLEITPGNRCDEHARGQATAPFDFLMHLRVGDGRPVAHQVEVPLAAMDAATDALDVACAARD